MGAFSSHRPAGSNTDGCRAEELGERGELGKEIFIQETYFNSWDNRLALLRAVQDWGVPVRYVFQWPLRFGTDSGMGWPSGHNIDDLSPFFTCR